MMTGGTHTHTHTVITNRCLLQNSTCALSVRGEDMREDQTVSTVVLFLSIALPSTISKVEVCRHIDVFLSSTGKQEQMN